MEGKIKIQTYTPCPSYVFFILYAFKFVAKRETHYLGSEESDSFFHCHITHTKPLLSNKILNLQAFLKLKQHVFL